MDGRRWMVCAGALVAMALASLAMEGKDGASTTLVVDSADVLTDIGASGSPSWSSMDGEFQIGGDASSYGPGGGIAVDGSSLYAIVYGYRSGPDNTTHIHTGLVRYDGTSSTALLQSEPRGGGLSKWMWIRAVETDPMSGHPVVLVFRARFDSGGTATEVHADLVAVDPDSLPALTTDSAGEPLGYSPLFTFSDLDGSDGWSVLDAGLAVAADGTIYLGPMADGSIASISPDATGVYSLQSADVSPAFDAGGPLLLGPDGDIYTWERGFDWNGLEDDGAHRTIYRIDADSGSPSAYAAVAKGAWVYGWTFDSNGRFWIGLGEAYKRKGRTAYARYVAEVVSEATTSRSGAVSDSPYNPMSLAADGSGNLYVLDSHVAATPVAGRDDAIWLLTPGSDTGGGGGKGGGGNGGGKGKNK